MKIGKSPVGVIGFTTSSATMSVWAKWLACTYFLTQSVFFMWWTGTIRTKDS